MNDQIVGLDDLPREWQLFVKMAVGQIAGLRKANQDLAAAHSQALRLITGPKLDIKLAYERKVGEVLRELRKKHDLEQAGPGWDAMIASSFEDLMMLALKALQDEQTTAPS